MSEENVCGACDAGLAKIDKVTGAIDGGFEKLVDCVGAKPLANVVKIVNRWVAALAPLVIPALSLLAGLVVFCRLAAANAPFKLVIQSSFTIILLSLVVLVVEKKALNLAVSVVAKSEKVAVRPELLRLAAVLTGALAAAFALIGLFSFELSGLMMMVESLLIALLLIVLFKNPELVGVSAETPKSLAEEVFALVLLPLRVALSFMPIIVMGLYLYAMWDLYSNLFDVPGEILVFFMPLVNAAFGQSLAMVILLPLAMWLAFLGANVLIDIATAIMSIPRKLDELKK